MKNDLKEYISELIDRAVALEEALEYGVVIDIYGAAGDLGGASRNLATELHRVYSIRVCESCTHCSAAGAWCMLKDVEVCCHSTHCDHYSPVWVERECRG